MLLDMHLSIFVALSPFNVIGLLHIADRNY